MPGQITGVINDGDNVAVILVATVSGGTPEADTFTWTLPDGTELLPEQTSGSFSASDVAVSLCIDLAHSFAYSPLHQSQSSIVNVNSYQSSTLLQALIF